MTVIEHSGTELALRTVEKMVPIIDWWAHLNKVAAQCIANLKKRLIKVGYKYADVDYWRCIIFGVMKHFNTKDATDELNDLLWIQKKITHKKGRKPSPKHLGGLYPRYERLTPNESQINDFIRKLPKFIKASLVEWIFKAQIDVALKLKLLKKEIECYIDYTDRFFYGADEYPDNKEIIGVYNGPGTNKARKYFGLMICSEGTRLFAGIGIIQKGKKRVLTIQRAIQLLLKWGFKIKRIEGDREFSTYDIIGGLAQMDLHYTGTIKKTAPIKRIVDDYIDGKCKLVVKHTLNPHRQTYYKFGPIPVYLIMKTDPGKRMRNVRKDLKLGKITRDEARERVHVFVTTEKPPPQKGKLTRWGLRLVQNFRKRWRIETGFRDLNRWFPTSHARSNDSKLFWMCIRMFAYNAWQIQRALYKRLRNVPKVWKKGPTLRRFGSVQGMVCVQ